MGCEAAADVGALRAASVDRSLVRLERVRARRNLDAPDVSKSLLVFKTDRRNLLLGLGVGKD